MITFPTNKDTIEQRVASINPVEYAKTRNYINGHVSYLSPYISRGVLTTLNIFEHLISTSYSWEECESFIKELAWRDFFQYTWQILGTDINKDIKQVQSNVLNRGIPRSINDASTGIVAIDSAIQQLYKYGYMHNHVRMYTASIICNIAHCHWLQPANWMYYHLLDADWASNACSWQWVAGSFSNKLYYANQENINRFTGTEQRNTFLDTSYEALPILNIPDVLQDITTLDLSTNLPLSTGIERIDTTLPTLLFNWYNLDSNWHHDMNANRILLLEPSVFQQYPISSSSVRFMLELASNIPNLIIYTGEFSEMKLLVDNKSIYFKQHPMQNYVGLEEKRKSMATIPEKELKSFFSYWKYIEPELRQEFNL